MSHTPLTCRRHGFTLIELLVVIVIIAILAGLAFPIIRNTKRSANEARCLGNLRALIQGWSLYCGDHRGKSVVIGVNEDSSNKYFGWVSQVRPYLQGGNIDAILLCPEASIPDPSGAPRGTYQYAWKNANTVCSYGLNARWYIWPTGVSSDFDTYPQNYYQRQMNGTAKEGPVFSDSVWVDFDRGSGPPSNYETAAGSGYYAIVRHRGKGVNMAFADSSVRFVSMGELFSTMKIRPNDVIQPGWINQVPAAYQ